MLVSAGAMNQSAGSGTASPAYQRSVRLESQRAGYLGILTEKDITEYSQLGERAEFGGPDFFDV